MQPPPPPEPLYILRGHRAAVQSTAFFPGCGILAAGDGEGELKLWDLDSRRVTASTRAHESHSGILQVACPVGSSQHIVSQGRDGVIKVWQVHSGSSIHSTPVQVLLAGSYNFCRFALLQQGQTSSSCSLSAPVPPSPAAAAAAGNSTQQPGVPIVKGFQPPEQAENSCGLCGSCPDHTVSAATVAKAGGQQQPRSIRGLLSDQLYTLQQQQDLLYRRHRQQDSLSAVPGCLEPLSGLDLSGQPDLTEEAEENLVRGVPAAAVLAAEASKAGAVDSSASGSSSSSIGADTPAAAAGDGPCLLALPASNCADVGVWQLGNVGSSTADPGSTGTNSSSSSSSQVMLLKQQRSSERPSHGLCMAVALVQPEGRALHALTGYEDGTVALWDTRQPQNYLASTKLHTESVMCLAAAPNCKSGFSGSADEQLAAFDLSIPNGQLKLAQQLTIPTAGIADIAIRPDGRITATAGWDGKVRIWHARKRQPLAVLRWHSQQAACVAFSSDCRLLATGGRDNHISMWSIYPPSA